MAWTGYHIREKKMIAITYPFDNLSSCCLFMLHKLLLYIWVHNSCGYEIKTGLKVEFYFTYTQFYMLAKFSE